MKGRASARSSTRSRRNAWRFRWRTAPSRSTSPSRPGSSCTRCCVAADPILLFGAGLLGLCLGSFLNVCIVRLPNDQSLLSPPSACPHCKHPIAWRDNIPVASWLLLKGRCRHCGAPIRSEERRVGKECRCRLSPAHVKNTNGTITKKVERQPVARHLGRE